ncbi:hypothetical protein Tco_0351581 [Tanacetum coccineum]
MVLDQSTEEFAIHFPFLYSTIRFVVTMIRSEEIVDHIPAISPISLADLPWTNQIFHEVALHLKSLSEIAQSLLLSTIYELEPDAIDVILAKDAILVYVIGPYIP